MSDTPRSRRRRADDGSAAADGALVTGTPAAWPRARSGRPASAPGRLGWDTPRPSLEAPSAPIRPLETSGSVLPELEEAPEQRRSLWRHPASIISMVTTVLAIAAFVVFLVLGGFSSTPAASDLEIEVTDGMVRASWTGPDVPYQVIVVDGPAGDAVDVSQLVTGTEVWLPRAAALVDEGSCIVVRPADGNETAEVALDRATLEGQGGVSECVSDASVG